jgi:hypothetical protein
MKTSSANPSRASSVRKACRVLLILTPRALQTFLRQLQFGSFCPNCAKKFPSNAHRENKAAALNDLIR